MNEFAENQQDISECLYTRYTIQNVHKISADGENINVSDIV